jgi:hypothetical protein
MQPILKPVWIRYYGLIPMTRRGYLLALGSAAAVLLLFLVAGAALELLPPLDTLWSGQHRLPGSGFGTFSYNFLYWVVIVCLTAQVVDTWCTLRIFARAEAEQWARLSKTSDAVSECSG